jgi:phage tail-like protein
MAVGDRRDPYQAHRFLVEVDGLVVGGFNEVTGLGREIEVLDYREGGVNDHLRRRAGPTRYPSNLTLRRGITDSAALWDWSQDTLPGTVRRRNGSIVLLDESGEEVWRWNFTGAYPVRWSGPELRAQGGAIAMESLELAHHGLSRGGAAG